MRYALTWSDARVRRVCALTPTIRLLEIVPESGPPVPHALGAHINVAVTIHDRPDTRSYSLVGEPRPDCYRIAVKLHPDSRGGSAYMWTLREGARLTVSAPQSLFEIDYGRPDYLLMAGGIGITPILGMATTLARRGENLRMVYAARSPEELAFADELAAVLGPRLQTFATSRGERLDIAAALGGLAPGGLAAVCGPLPMLDAAKHAWKALGRSPADLRFETFGSSGTLPTEPFRVRLPQHGLEIEVGEHESMLDALADAGIEIMSDCRRGECGICAVDVLDVAGAIDHRDVFFSEHQRRENHKMCACVSRAVGTVTIDSLYRSD